MRKILMVTPLFTVALLMFFAPAVTAGTIAGTVKVNGLRTPANVLVYLAKTPAAADDLSTGKFVMDQRYLEFRPHVLPVLVGAAVEFPNHDKVNHNVFSMSRTKKFNLGSYPPGQSKTVVFDKPGIVELRCDVHAEMAAYILVMKTPYFAVTDKQGRFEIPATGYLKQAGLTGVQNPAAGRYVLKTWHEKLKSQKKSVIVPENGAVSVEFNLSRGVPGVLYK